MEANELRIGNYVKIKNSEIVSIVDIITGSDLHLAGNGVINRYNEIEPIPLTEKWLLDFGFEWNQIVRHFTYDWGRNGTVFVRYDRRYNAYGIQLSESKYLIVDTVHRFQNVIFALTGEELTINTPTRE